MAEPKKYILTLSCRDAKGIVAKILNFLFEKDTFIIESAQWSDPYSYQFFFRTVFTAGKETPKLNILTTEFKKIADKFQMSWEIYDAAVKPRVLLMVSKQGHCLNDLLHRYASGYLDIEIPAVISNHKDLEHMAKWYDIPYYHMPVTPETKHEQEEEIWKLSKKLKTDLVVLARYMQVLSPELIGKIGLGKAINIHHSFLPGFKGAKPYHQAYYRGVKIIGATAHYVSNDLDEGPIIEQGVERVDHSCSPEKLLEIGRDIESGVLADAVKYHVERRVLLNGNKTVVFA